MIDSLAAPQWISNEDSNLCSRCRDPFTLTNRRHHCRNCGQLFDQKCSSNTLALAHFGITQPVRVCDGCYKKIKLGRRVTLDSSTSLPSNTRTSSRLSVASSREDDDLERAIRASLADARPHSYAAPSAASGYRPSYSESFQKKDQKAEVEDPDLAAAIAASLRDMELAPSAPPGLQTPAAGTHDRNPIDSLSYERLVRSLVAISRS
jgi:growth factor-regulated tyrosine kinase substrate